MPVAQITFFTKDGNVTIDTGGTTNAIRYKIEWGDGTVVGINNAPPNKLDHFYLNDGNYQIKFTVWDSHNHQSSRTLPVLIVRNPTVTAPTAPSGLNSSLISNNQIDLTWTDNASNETGFELQCQIDGGSFFNRTQLPPNTVAFSDLQVTAGHTYTYRVRAFNAGGFSSFSNTTSQTTGVTTYDFIVANGGVDSAGTPGTLAQPFATVDYGMQRATATLSGSGKIVGVRGFNYNQAIRNPSGVSGTSWTNKIRVVNYEGETVNFLPTVAQRVFDFDGAQSFIEIDGINGNAVNVVDDGVKITDGFGAEQAHHIRLMNLEIKNANNGQGISCQTGPGTSHGGGNEFLNLLVHDVGATDFDHGFYIAAPNCIVTDCEVYNCRGSCIQLQGNDVAASNCTVAYNLCHDSRGLGSGDSGRRWGIVVSGSVGGGDANNLIHHNIIYNIHNPLAWGYGIHLFHGISNGLYFNLCYNCDTNGILIEAATSNNIVRDNVSWGNGSNSLADNYTNLGGTTTQDHNDFTGGANPGWVNVGVDNFHLISGSRLRGAGVAVPGITVDFDGVLLTNPPDIGPYQFV